MPGTVYTVASGKGGVGKTTTSVNLAVALWREGNAVALVDADIGMANLAAVLDLEPEETLHDVLAGRATVDEAVIEAKDGDLMVLAGSRSLDSFADADPNALRAAVSDLADRADYVIVDTGAGLSYEDVLPLGMADGVVLVTTPDPAAFGDTMKTMEIADLLGAPVRGLVITRAVEDTDSEAIAGEIGAELLGTIPEDPAVMASTVAGDPLESHAPDSEAAAAYRDLADTLLSGDEAWLEEHAREPTDEAPAGPGEGGPEDSRSTGATDDADDAAAPPEPEDAHAADDAPTDVGADDAHDDEVSTEADESGSEEAAVSEADPAPEATAADDLEPGEPTDGADEPATFPAGGVQREGARTGGKTASDGASADDGGARDEVSDADAGDEVGDEGGEDEVGGDDDADDERAGDGRGEGDGEVDAGDDTSEAEASRGGLFGWLGRLFS